MSATAVPPRSDPGALVALSNQISALCEGYPREEVMMALVMTLDEVINHAETSQLREAALFHFVFLVGRYCGSY
jgi:hypothetical protein